VQSDQLQAIRIGLV